MTNLQAPFGALAYFLDLDPPTADFLLDVKEGLSKDQKALSPMYFYDQRGSALFDQITTLEEYYPTRTEAELVVQNEAAIRDAIGPGVSIMEYGSGSSEKIRKLISLLDGATSYIAMDISRDHLIENATNFAEASDLPVAAVCADFNSSFSLPEGHLPEATRHLGYFPGSTLGNLTPQDASSFLQNASATLGEDALFLIGVDLKKNEQQLKAAYDDAKGITAAFNLNLLHRMKTELGAIIEIDAFTHEARVKGGTNEQDTQRIEMHLVAQRETIIKVDNEEFHFRTGESLHTENSHKFTVKTMESIVKNTPWRILEWWTDDKDWFGSCLLSNS